MKTFMSVLLLTVVSFSGWAQNKSTEIKSSVVAQKSPQVVELDRATKDKFKQIERYLPSKTKRKAKPVIEALRKRLALSIESDDLYQLAKGEIIKQFTALTPEQLDLMVIYTLMKASQQKSSAADRVAVQQTRNRANKVMSNITKTNDDTKNSVIQKIG